ncbi:MAG: AI-2E family transporter [Treponema sp.]|jgi:predicted PurR-regulated permease PerM|nr:AI-2E family transporter [Treponema sp.]
MTYSSKSVQAIVFGAILVFLFILVCRLFAPFFTMLLWSVLFYILLSPVHQKLTGGLDRNKLRGKILRNFWAGLFSLTTVFIILIPLTFIGFQFFRQVTEMTHLVRQYLMAHPESGIIDRFLEDLSDIAGDLSSGLVVIDSQALRERLLEYIGSSLQNILLFSSTIARNVGSFFTGLVFMVFSLFFFYMDGSYLSRLFLHVIPIKREYIIALVSKFKEIVRNLVLGYIMVALVQALMAFFVYSIFRVQGALVFAVLTFLCAFIPMVGAGIVWFPIGLTRIINGDVSNGILFLVASGILISTLDNVLRPFFLRDRIQLHPLIIFLAILGGISAFGFNGIILGPMVVILFLTVLDLFLTEHRIEQD